MLKISNFEVMGWEHAIRGMRNPMNSWEKSDSCTQGYVWCNEFCGHPVSGCDKESGLYLGPNDLNLMKRLRNAGTDHRKFMRMIVIYVDLTAAEKKAMDIEIRRQLAEYDLKHANELDAMILWHLHEEFGFGPKRLKQFYDTFAVRLDELIKHYEMTDSDMVWLCTYKLKQYGIDIEEWNKQRRD